MEERSETYDVVVIGSGMGGLSAASLLAGLHGRRVCVLERHSTPGGFTHSFRRPGGWEWDVGLHYVGDMAPGALPRRLMDRITGGAVTWQRLPEPFEQLHFPDFGFAFQGNPEAFAADLAAAFPAVTLIVFKFIRPEMRATGAKLEPYECGVPPEGSSRGRYSVRFYIVAILFVIFDVETIFLFPWAIKYSQLGAYGLVTMLVFLGILLVGYVWLYRKGALDWV